MNINLKLIKAILMGDRPSFPSMRTIGKDSLSTEGLPMGTLFIGRQGSGKTTSLASHLVEQFKTFHDRAIFVLDWSGSITDSILSLILKDEERDNLIRRVVFDELGNPEWVVPMPEFSHLYGAGYEGQVQRVVENMAKLSPYLLQNAPVLGGLAVTEIAPHFFRLLTAIHNEVGDPIETWQITEAKRLMIDRTLLKTMLQKYGSRIPGTKWFLEKEYLNQEMKSSERELRTYSLRGILNTLDAKGIKARLGYPVPGWTPREAILNGKMVLIDGANLINEPNVQHYLFTQVYSLIMAEIKKRRPADQTDKPVSLVMDEVYSLLSIPGMAEELSQLAPQYRSRKLQLYVVLQTLAQLSKELRPHIWSLGNVVSFGVSNFDEAYEIAQQLFKYEPTQVKLRSSNPDYNPILENDRGQYLEIANWIQRLKHRECIMRRYVSEREKDRFILHVLQTMTRGGEVDQKRLDELKEELLRERAIRIREALSDINRRIPQKSEAEEGYEEPPEL